MMQAHVSSCLNFCLRFLTAIFQDVRLEIWRRGTKDDRKKHERLGTGGKRQM